MADKKKTKQPQVEQQDEGGGTVVIPGAGSQQQQKPPKSDIPEEVAVIPLRNMVMFPGAVLPIGVGREKTLQLVQDVLPEQKVIGAVCQRDPETEEPTTGDLYRVGTAMNVLKLLRNDQGQQNIIVHGLRRFRVRRWAGEDPYFRAEIEVLEEAVSDSTESEALMVNVRNQARRIIELSPNIPDEAATVLENVDRPGQLADFLAANLQIETEIKQQLLEELDVNQRLHKISNQLQKQLEVLELSSKIQDQVKSNIDESQRRYFLQEQLKAIKRELGQYDEKTAEVQEIREKIESSGMPENAANEAERELSRLEQIPTISPEYNIVRTYLDWMTDLPWDKSTEDNLDVKRAEKILDADHYDLQKVKRRILEYLSVRKLAPGSRGPILCFVGPPGVGKTSLGQSIARALGRKFRRMSLGGMRDEAELRGHRRTYIGALPGRIIQEIRKAGTNNPVFMLDEVDKVGADFRGDPTSALLEILDPAQNNTFQDHYLNVPFDLSKVMFIGTANYMAPVPPALVDRMEVLELPGYTEEEKLQIAKKYLVPRQLKENGLNKSQAKWRVPAIRKIIRQYTREAGVRELERQIAAVCRAVAAQIASGDAKTRTVNEKFITRTLGPRKYQGEVAQRTSTPGVATGLAYTPTGGEIIFVEAAAYPGKGNLTLTGQIGQVMKESAQAALSLVKTRAADLGFDAEQMQKRDIHLHVPAGAVQKDGPSAGIAMFTALTSLFSQKTVRPDVALTGEVTLRGLVLPVGGIKEKALAAKRAGIKEIILPDRNEKDMPDVPPAARKELEFHFVSKVDEVLDIAFGKKSGRGKGRKRSKSKSKGSQRGKKSSRQK